jgi:hypothetical protein
MRVYSVRSNLAKTTRYFRTKAEAMRYARHLAHKGHRDIEVQRSESSSATP